MMLFTRYFDQIIAGVDQLTQESDEPIAMMSPELDFMRSKLTEVQTKAAPAHRAGSGRRAAQERSDRPSGSRHQKRR